MPPALRRLRGSSQSVPADWFDGDVNPLPGSRLPRVERPSRRVHSRMARTAQRWCENASRSLYRRTDFGKFAADFRSQRARAADDKDQTSPHIIDASRDSAGALLQSDVDRAGKATLRNWNGSRTRSPVDWPSTFFLPSRRLRSESRAAKAISSLFEPTASSARPTKARFA